MIPIYIEDFLSRLSSVKGSRGQYSAKCPAHEDKHASLSISQSNDGKILLNCHAGCTAENIMSALGLSLSDLFQTDRQQYSQYAKTSSSSGAVTYDYQDLDGNIIAKKLRYPNKSFCWLKPNGKGGWAKGRAGKGSLFNQYDVKNEKALYIVEGEKDVLTLSRYKKPAVSLPDGAKSKWLSEYGNFFKGKTVAIIQDNDTPGKEFAQTLATNLFEVAASVRVIDLTRIWDSMPEKADVSDYLSAYPNGVDNLSKLANSTEEWKPKTDMSKYIRLSDVESTKTEWLWYPYIPLGKITLMTADPGTGKTFLSLYLTAQVSTGRPFYGQELYNKPGVVVYQTAEDGVSDTIKPRLDPMKPNFENIYIFNEENESLSLSDEKIEQIMKDLHPKLMIFDPLQAYLGSDVDMHRANEVRPVLGRIGHLAEKYKCAVIFIMHNSKMSQNSALHRALGSIDIPAVARSMLILGKDPDNPNKGKIMCHEKSSLAPHGKSILFEVDPSLGGIVFSGFSDLKADDILNVRSGTRNKPSTTRDEIADELLTEYFGKSDHIILPSIKNLCEELECSRGTLYNARDELQLQYFSVGYGKGKMTYWLLPDVDIENFKREHNLVSLSDDLEF